MTIIQPVKPDKKGMELYFQLEDICHTLQGVMFLMQECKPTGNLTTFPKISKARYQYEKDLAAIQKLITRYEYRLHGVYDQIKPDYYALMAEVEARNAGK